MNGKLNLTAADLDALAAGAPATQSTMIEQSRARAEVETAMIAAKRFPRDETAARARVLRACQNKTLAERAFFSYSRGGQTISGPSIHLATELARCWGNMLFGIAELDRTEEGSEMLAFAWDMETNARNSNAFVNPHLRDTKRGPQVLSDMRDIYENNANLGARRLRECIMRIIPVYVREDAIAEVHKTLRSADKRPIEERIADLIRSFDAIGVTKAQIAHHQQRDVETLTEVEIANLGVLYRSIVRAEVRKDDVFEPVVTAKALEHQAAGNKAPDPKAKTSPPKTDPKPEDPPPTAEPEPEPEKAKTDPKPAPKADPAQPSEDDPEGFSPKARAILTRLEDADLKGDITPEMWWRFNKGAVEMELEKDQAGQDAILVRFDAWQKAHDAKQKPADDDAPENPRAADSYRADGLFADSENPNPKEC